MACAPGHGSGSYNDETPNHILGCSFLGVATTSKTCVSHLLHYIVTVAEMFW